MQSVEVKMSKYPKTYPAKLPPSVRQPCSTARRLEMARTLAAGATCPTSRKLADNAIGAWWPGLTADRFRWKGDGRP